MSALYIYVCVSAINLNYLQDEEIEELSSKPDSQVLPEKRKLSVESNNTNAKKIVLNRKPVLEEIKNDQVEENENKTVKEPDAALPEKKIIKLSELSTKEVIEKYIIFIC